LTGGEAGPADWTLEFSLSLALSLLFCSPPAVNLHGGRC